MAQNYLVVGTWRPNRLGITHEHITRLVYYDPAKEENWNIKLSAAIKNIEDGKSIFFVHEGGRSINLSVVDGKNAKYLRTNADGTTRDNLLSLPITGTD